MALGFFLVGTPYGRGHAIIRNYKLASNEARNNAVASLCPCPTHSICVFAVKTPVINASGKITVMIARWLVTR